MITLSVITLNHFHCYSLGLFQICNSNQGYLLMREQHL
jgi:hypothetical protein